MAVDLVRISKSFKWEMAHRLPYHKAGCQNLHGHSYRLDVAIEGSPLPNGMVMDYGELKALVQPLVDKLDHAFMCSADDTMMIDFLKGKDLKVVHVDFYSTAENIALYLAREIASHLRSFSNLRRLNLRVAETLHTYAEVSTNLNE